MKKTYHASSTFSFVLPKLEYYNGDTIEGDLVYHPQKEVKEAQAITLRLRKYSKVEIEGGSYTGGRTLAKFAPSYLWGSQRSIGNPQLLPTANKAMPFSIKIPEDSLASMDEKGPNKKDPSGGIYYDLVATIEPAEVEEKKKKKSKEDSLSGVLQLKILTTYSSIPRKTKIHKQITLNKGNVELWGNLDSDFAYIGKPTYVNVEVKNDDPKGVVEHITLNLLKYCNFHAQSPSNTSRSMGPYTVGTHDYYAIPGFDPKKGKAKDNPLVGPNSSLQKTLNFQIPLEVPLTVRCQDCSVAYKLEIVAMCSKKKSVSVEFDLIIAAPPNPAHVATDLQSIQTQQQQQQQQLQQLQQKTPSVAPPVNLQRQPTPTDLIQQTQSLNISSTLPTTQPQSSTNVARPGPPQIGRVLYDFTPTNPKKEISLKAGELVNILDRSSKEWWLGEARGNRGFFPSTFVEILIVHDPNNAQPQAPRAQSERPQQMRSPQTSYRSSTEGPQQPGPQNVDTRTSYLRYLDENPAPTPAYATLPSTNMGLPQQPPAVTPRPVLTQNPPRVQPGPTVYGAFPQTSQSPQVQQVQQPQQVQQFQQVQPPKQPNSYNVSPPSSNAAMPPPIPNRPPQRPALQGQPQQIQHMPGQQPQQIQHMQVQQPQQMPMYQVPAQQTQIQQPQQMQAQPPQQMLQQQMYQGQTQQSQVQQAQSQPQQGSQTFVRQGSNPEKTATLRIQSTGLETWEIPYHELTIISKIGGGSYGDVFQGLWRTSRVAIKQLKEGVISEDALEGFRQEALIQKNLRPHANVVLFYGVSTTPGHPLCLVAEYLALGSLQNWLQNNPNPVKREVMDIISGAAAGMFHLHCESLIHRDLAARNVLLQMVDSKYVAKIADFGMTRLLNMEAQGQTIANVGPLRWMAPESIRSRTYSTKSDSWSFGVLMWECTNQGAIPYGHLSQFDAGVQVCYGGLRLPPISEREWPGIAGLMQRCFLEPADRPDMLTIFQEVEKSKPLYG